MTSFRIAALASAACLAALPAMSLQESVTAGNYTLQVETVVEGLEHPWGMAFISEDRFLVSERNSGTVRVGSAAGGISEPVWTAEDMFRYEGETSRSQAGLFDIVLHPEFASNGWAYISYSRETDRGAAIAVIRARVVQDSDGTRLEDVEDIFVMKEEDQDSSGLHFGGRMAFDPSDNSLFLSIGERRNISRAQDASDQAGSILRMTDSGEPHEANARFEVEDEEGEPDPYLFSIGHRNVQALGVHPATHELWAADHGPQGGDEINLVAAGNNYGWPFVTGGKDYSDAPLGVGDGMDGMTPPVHVFEKTKAPSGLTFIPEGTAYEDWSGDMLIGAMHAEAVVHVRIEDGAVAGTETVEIGRRIRDVQLGPDGHIWLLTEHSDGQVLRLAHAAD